MSKDTDYYKIGNNSGGLGAEKEKELSRIIKHSNKPDAKNKAIEELVNGNLAMVVKCAQEVFNGYHANLTLMDLIAEGNFWLFYCARHFSYKKDTKFITYAYPIIRWNMWLAINTDTLIHIPYNLLGYKSKFKKLKDISKTELTKEALMREFDVLGGKAENINDAFKLSVTSLDNTINEDGLETLNDIIPDNNAINPSIEADRNALKEYLSKISNKCLNDKEKQVIDMIFYEDEGISFKDLAKKLKLTNERIRQIYVAALRKMRNKFFDEWDSLHNPDILDKEEIHKEATGDYGFCYNYKMRLENDIRFYEKLSEKIEKKSKKILRDFA